MLVVRSSGEPVAASVQIDNHGSSSVGPVRVRLRTDVNAVLPTRGILAVAALLCAAFFIATIWTRAWRR